MSRLILIIVVLQAAPFSTAQEASQEELRKRLRELRMELTGPFWATPAPSQDVESIRGTQRELVRGEAAVLADPKAPRRAIHQAAVNLAAIGSAEAIGTLAAHLDRYAPGPGDEAILERSYPCVMALRNIGWASIPALVSRLQDGDGERDPLLIAAGLAEIAGREPARAILERALDGISAEAPKARVAEALSYL